MSGKKANRKRQMRRLKAERKRVRYEAEWTCRCGAKVPTWSPICLCGALREADR